MDSLLSSTWVAILMSILRPDGVQFGKGYGYSASENLQTSGWFHYRWTETSGTAFDGTSVVGQTTGTMNLPPRAKLFVYTNTPLRGDTNAWGGHYEDLQYNVNSAGWVSVGRSGFVSRMMTDNYPITAHKDFCVLDFNSITTNFTLQLRTAHFHHNGGGSVNSSCGIGGGDNNTTYDGNNQQYSTYKQMIVMGYGQGPSS